MEVPTHFDYWDTYRSHMLGWLDPERILPPADKEKHGDNIDPATFSEEVIIRVNISDVEHEYLIARYCYEKELWYVSMDGSVVIRDTDINWHFIPPYKESTIALGIVGSRG